MTSEVQYVSGRPRGAFRTKYFCSIGLLGFAASVPLTKSGSAATAWLLSLYCIIAVIAGGFEARSMWIRRQKRQPQWVAVLATLLGGGAFGLLLIARDKGFQWDLIYVELPLTCYLLIISAAAWITEWRKSVLIYSELQGLAFAKPPAAPLGWIARTSLSLVSVVIVWASFVTLRDEPADEGLQQFFFVGQHHGPEKQDIGIGIMGLEAPAGSDFQEHGKFVAATMREHRSWAESKRIIEARGKLKTDVAVDFELDCFLGLMKLRTPEKCASEGRVKELLASNAELLRRYRYLYGLSYAGAFDYNAALLITINKLIAAEIELDMRRGRNELAYEKWRANYQFVARLNAADATWVGKAILLVIEGYTLSTVESIMRHAPALAVSHYEELIGLLRPGDLERYNVPGIMRAEYALIDRIFEKPAELQFWVHPTFNRNRFFRYSQDFLRAAHTPATELSTETQRIAAGYSPKWRLDYLRDPMNAAFFYVVLVHGQLETGQMLQQMYIHEGHRRLLVLRVEVAKEKISDEAIPAFLQSASMSLRNPFTGGPMQWNSTDRVLYFDIPGSNGAARKVPL